MRVAVAARDIREVELDILGFFIGQNRTQRRLRFDRFVMTHAE
jgi:hypothetical protein